MIPDDFSLFDEHGHLLDVVLGDLAHGGRSANAERHLAECPLCRIRLRRLTDANELPVDLDAIVRSVPSMPSVPPGVLAVLSHRNETEPEPQEVWLTVGPKVSMVWIRRILGTSALVQPVVFDTEMADEHTLVLAPETNPFGLPLAIFCSFDAQVDRETLDRRLFRLPIEPAIDALRSARRTGTTTPPDLVVGPPIEDVADERHEFRQIVADRLVAIESAGDANEEPGIADFEGRVEDLCFRRHHCRKLPCGDVVAKAAAASGWRALVIVREIDPIVVLLGSLAEPFAPDARAIIELANATAVAFVEDLVEFETRVYETSDLAERRFAAPTGETLGANTHATPAPFEDALFKYLDAMSLFDESLGIRDADEIVSDDIEEIALAQAQSAVESAKSHSYRRLKGEAFKALDEADVGFIAKLIKAGAAGEPLVDVLHVYSQSR